MLSRREATIARLWDPSRKVLFLYEYYYAVLACVVFPIWNIIQHKSKQGERMDFAFQFIEQQSET